MMCYYRCILKVIDRNAACDCMAVMKGGEAITAGKSSCGFRLTTLRKHLRPRTIMTRLHWAVYRKEPSISPESLSVSNNLLLHIQS